MADIPGTPGNDTLVGTDDDDTITALVGNDTITGGLGDDQIDGGDGNDVANVTVATDGADSTNLGEGSDTVNVTATGQVRLSFTSSQVGNGNALDSNTMPNQDGGLAVRLQAEDGSDGLTGPVGRFDDEGITFVASAGASFDVRDLVSGVQRGDRFEVVTLGTSRTESISAALAGRPYYINAGMGNDAVTGGDADDFLVGGAGNDTLSGGLGNDSFIAGAGNDTVTGGAGNDTAIFNVATDGEDQVDLGAGSDVVNVTATGQVRLTFTSAQVGNGNALDSNTMANQDGGLAVRLQAEAPDGRAVGRISRFDDEGVTFVASAGASFDVRDLVSGVQRGDQFEVVTLGTSGNDTLTALQAARPYYFNAGMGNDSVTGGDANDFLEGGAGNDTLSGGLGNDTFIAGLGNDTIAGGDGADTAIFNVATDSEDRVDLGDGSDTVNVTTTGQVRLSFTSSEVGNGNALDSDSLANQDGGLAVRFQQETAGRLTGRISRFDDEGITFVASAGASFDVRDLVSGVQRGDTFEVVRLGTSGNDTLDAVQAGRPYYINAGMGSDTVTGGDANDFLVGGAGNDTLSGGLANDSFIGGGGNDEITGGDGTDTAIFNVATDGTDTVNLGDGSDAVNITATGQVRLSFTSSEVGNGNALDANGSPNQDGGLAVRLQAEDGSDGLSGPVSRFDDEGTTFVASAGASFDVRDLVSGVQRGDTFEVVVLGTSGNDTLTAVQAARPYYFNAGMGNDSVTGGSAADFLVGGAGGDTLLGGAGNDRFIGGGGNDQIDGGADTDRAVLSFAQGDATYSFGQNSVTISSAEGTDTYTNVEEFQFTGGVVLFEDLPRAPPPPPLSAGFGESDWSI